MQSKKYVSFLIAGLLVASFVVALPAFAQTAPGGQGGRGQGFGGGRMNGQQNQLGIFGTVSAINGTTLTVTSANRTKPGSTATTTAPTAVTYTVDANNAKVTKNNTASTLVGITVGDTVMVQGTVSGTNVTATNIRDGVRNGMKVAQPSIQGNGQPIVAGSITSINGNTIAITNKSNVAYSIDASNAKFVENGVTSPTISNVAVGDNIVVQGTVNGNSVTASSVIDQKAPVKNSQSGNQKSQSGFGGIVNGIGSFFKKLFGF